MAKKKLEISKATTENAAVKLLALARKLSKDKAFMEEFAAWQAKRESAGGCHAAG